MFESIILLYFLFHPYTTITKFVIELALITKKKVYTKDTIDTRGVVYMKTVAVIGGGITGVSTMYYLNKKLKEENIEARLVLVEKNPYLGGKMHYRL